MALEYIHIKYGTYIYKQSLFYLFKACTCICTCTLYLMCMHAAFLLSFDSLLFDACVLVSVFAWPEDSTQRYEIQKHISKGQSQCKARGPWYS